MLDLIWVLLELFGDAALQLVLELVADLISRLLFSAGTTNFKNPWTAYIGYMLLGTAAGGLSLFIFPHPLIHPSRIAPGMSVILSPVLSGLGMWALGTILRRRNKQTTPIESFGYAFSFAFGMAVVRFLFASGRVI